MTSGIASALTGVLQTAGIKLEVTAPPAVEPTVPPAASPGPVSQSAFKVTPAGAGRPIGTPASRAPAPAARAPLPPPKPAAATKAPPRGPSPVEVMGAVQNAVVGAVSMVTGTVAGVRAAGEAARAASKTATGAGAVASGMATVASGFFPQLTKLGVGVSKAPKNRPGMRPQRRVADIIANPMGRTPPKVEGAPAQPVQRVRRIPMVRAKSSLDLGRKSKTRRVRSMSDLAMRPQLGLTPHEILLKVATLALGKTLLGFLESGARAQQEALQRVNERMSQKQVMLLGMLPAQYIVQKLPPQQPEPLPEPVRPAATAAPVVEKSNSIPANPLSGANSTLKVRY